MMQCLLDRESDENGLTAHNRFDSKSKKPIRRLTNGDPMSHDLHDVAFIAGRGLASVFRPASKTQTWVFRRNGHGTVGTEDCCRNWCQQVFPLLWVSRPFRAPLTLTYLSRWRLGWSVGKQIKVPRRWSVRAVKISAVFEPIFKNGSFLSFVALVSLTLWDSNPRPPRKRSILAPTPSFPPPRRMTRGKKQYSQCFWEGVAGRRPATPSEEHGLCPPVGFQLPFLLNCRPQAGNVQQKGRWRSKGGVQGVEGVEGVRGVQCGVLGVVGFNFGFGWTKTTRNVTWGSILTPCRKMLKTDEKWSSGWITQKGWTNMGQMQYGVRA